MNNVTDRLVLFDFAGEDEVRNWRSINDVVMGGRSRGQTSWDDQGFLVFTGHVSFENGGGFASITSPPLEIPRTDWEALQIHSMGDGRMFKATLRTDTSMDGISYQHRFRATPGNWTMHTLFLKDFIPTYHGRILEDVPPPDPKALSRLGFIISDRQEGPFRLSIRLITIVKNLSPSPDFHTQDA